MESHVVCVGNIVIPHPGVLGNVHVLIHHEQLSPNIGEKNRNQLETADHDNPHHGPEPELALSKDIGRFRHRIEPLPHLP